MQDSCKAKVQNEYRARIIDFRVLYGLSTVQEKEDFLEAQGYDPAEVDDMGANEESDLWSELRANYGLCFDYIPPGYFTDQVEGFFCYQLSTGGPGDEFRFYTNPDFTVHRIEYWYLDWFDGAHVVLSGKDYELMKGIFEDFKDMGSVQFAYDKANED